MLFHEDGTQESQGGGTVGEDANDAFTPPQFLVETFLAVGGAQTPTIAAGQNQDGGGMIEALFADLHGLRCPVIVAFQAGIEQDTGGGHIGSGQDEAHLLGDLLLQGLGRGGGNVAGEMCLAALPGDPLENGGGRL